MRSAFRQKPRSTTTFATKDDILDALLTGTVDEPLGGWPPNCSTKKVRAAPRAARVGGRRRSHPAVRKPVEPRRRFYLLPELRLGRFEEFRLAPRGSCVPATAASARPGDPAELRTGPPDGPTNLWPFRFGSSR